MKNENSNPNEITIDDSEINTCCLELAIEQLTKKVKSL